jgi:hypothetical protein
MVKLGSGMEELMMSLITIVKEITYIKRVKVG